MALNAGGARDDICVRIDGTANQYSQRRLCVVCGRDLREKSVGCITSSRACLVNANAHPPCLMNAFRAPIHHQL